MPEGSDLQKLVERICGLMPEKAIHQGIVEYDIVPHFLGVVEPDMIQAVQIEQKMLYCHSNGSRDRYDFTELGLYDTSEPYSLFLAKEMNVREIGYDEAKKLVDNAVDEDHRNVKLYGKIVLELRTEVSIPYYYLIGVAIPKKVL